MEQPEFLCKVLEVCARETLHAAVDTCCHVEVEVLERVAQHTPLFLCDLKHMDSAEHELLTGVPNELILSNIRQLSAWGKPMCLRMPLIPGFNDGLENIRLTASFIASIKPVLRFDVLPYNRAGLDKIKRLGSDQSGSRDFGPSDDTHVDRIVRQFKELGVDAKVGG